MHTMLSAVMIFLAGPAFAADLLPLVMPVSHGVSAADRPTVNRCNEAIAQWAAPYDPVAIETSLVEPVRASAAGARIATLSVAIDYPSQGGVEPRSATIACTVASDGEVSVAVVKQG
ncbi:hypothetical protein [Sinorhizobium meliloti]|uniref:hypothetical protein n=1 Tax=Rhizobium meliloti TaxID=382 RepID=UPI000FD6E8FA|nr:hypothetical protein [Sinorhizobium meliloti]MCO5965716.1 hypothetical protein [Sinorhizobium meliloti]RVG05340.1 hypothetical protein CN231_30385 [Sinorhizobium meliloti]RVI71987.1 hypothetical protein CN188_33855 [Sinorhizobium meliloti]RVI90041.1 hypothetical protein CN193_33345 [Sinorhizobium meliloti]